VLQAVTEPLWAIRAATAADREFLVDMLMAATNWSPQWKPQSRSRILNSPRTAHYISGWPRDTDLGIVAEAGGAKIGATWLRYFTGDDRGYGYVSPGIPELTIGVAAPWRGRGVGRALLREIAARARTSGITQISLSVERKNHAQQLYLAEGYRVVDSSDRQSDTMVKDLTESAS
jgi:GNAT superfamily N-acetyltransferase